MAVKYDLFHGSEWHRSENDSDGAGHKPSNHRSENDSDGAGHKPSNHRSENDSDGAGHKPSNHSSGATSRLKAADIKYNVSSMNYNYL